MRFVHVLLRTYAYLYHFLLAGFLLGLSVVAYLSGTHSLDAGGMMSLTGQDLTNCLLGIGLLGVTIVLLVIFNKLRWLFPIYALGAVFTLFRWFFSSSFVFEDQKAFEGAAWLFMGAIGAFLCSLLELKRGRPAVHRKK